MDEASAHFSTHDCIVYCVTVKSSHVAYVHMNVLLYTLFFIFFPVFLYKCLVCVCVYEQHLQEGRKAQQYLDHSWKQMDNVSVEGGRRRRDEEKKIKCLV